MQLTAAIINAGLGDLTLGLEMAGFNVLAAYEADEKALAIHKKNFAISVLHDVNEEVPAVDLLVARIIQPNFSRAGARVDEFTYKVDHILRYLNQQKSKAFLFCLNVSSIKTAEMQSILRAISEWGYQLTCRVLDVSQYTGFPVNERMACVVGVLNSVQKEFAFPEPHTESLIPYEEFLEWNGSVDHQYIRVDPAALRICEDDSGIYCWKNHAYYGVNRVQWNTVRYPIIKDKLGYRKITYQEIAYLKGFPHGYILEERSKSWLCKNLMYAANVVVIRQIGEILRGMLEYDPWRSQQRLSRIRFKRLFGRYLSELSQSVQGATLEIEQEERQADFIFRQGNEHLYFEVKYYNNDYALSSKVKAACEHMKALNAGIRVLVIANEAPIFLKEECKEKYGVYIWDVSNLLWLFNDYPNIKNEFVASLSYSVDQIEPCAPVPNIHRTATESKQEEPDWRGRLRRIKPGTEQFREYEEICTEILKYVLGDYLTLWETQQQSNNGLYRFDLCCKIKSGADHDFFDTIKRYFMTKYIVFEFKNYKDEIGQAQIYTTEKYLYEKALRKVAIIISRFGANDHALQAARGTLRETGKLIICLSDNSLLDMIDIKDRGEQEPADYLGTILDDILVHLEK